MPPKKNNLSPENKAEYDKVMQSLQASGALQAEKKKPEAAAPPETHNKRKSGKQPEATDEQPKKAKRAKPAPTEVDAKAPDPEPKAKAKNKGGRPRKDKDINAGEAGQPKDPKKADKEKQTKTAPEGTKGGKAKKPPVKEDKKKEEEEEETVEEFYDNELGVMVSWKNFPEVVKKVLQVHPTETPATVAQGLTESLGPCPEELKGNIPEEASGSARHPGPILEDKSLQEKGDDNDEDLDGEEMEEEEEDEQEEEDEPAPPPPKPASKANPEPKGPTKPKTPPPTSASPEMMKVIHLTLLLLRVQCTINARCVLWCCVCNRTPAVLYQVTPKNLDKSLQEAEDPKESFRLKRMDSLMPHGYV